MEYERILDWRFDEVDAAYSDRDAMLYALGVGVGSDPTNSGELLFTTETNLRALPTLSTVVARNPPWLPKIGVRVTDAVHGEHRMRFHAVLKPAGRLRATSKVTALIDKGAGKAALIVVEQEIYDAVEGTHLATSTATNFIRGAGGFGGSSSGGVEAHSLPSRPADKFDTFRTTLQQSLLYRQNGDRNPLHFDPATAQAAGFPRPILHGFCTYGIACWQVLKTYCAHDPARLASLDVRFAAPALPGETLLTEFWRDGDVVSFRTRALESGAVALSNGRAELRG